MAVANKLLGVTNHSLIVANKILRVANITFVVANIPLIRRDWHLPIPPFSQKNSSSDQLANKMSKLQIKIALNRS